MKCCDCGVDIELNQEMNRCPKCQKHTLRNIQGVVLTEPEVAENMSGEKFIYFTVKTSDREVPVEVKQGYDDKPPVEKGDEVIVDCYRMKERIEGLRVNKLENKNRKLIYNYKSGCLLPLIGLLVVLSAAFCLGF